MTHTYAGLVAFFIDDGWNLIERMVDFKVVGEQEHQAAYAALSFVESAAGRGGLNKMSQYSDDSSPQSDTPLHALSHNE